MNRTLHKLEKQLSQLEKLIPFSKKDNTMISAAPVGWHISHSLKVCVAVFDALASSNPEDYRKEFSLPRLLVLVSGYIPRGKARAPKKVLPPEQIDVDELMADIRYVRARIKTFGNLPDKSFFEHPYFRKVSKAKTSRFLVVHTRHHLKIIHDILKKE